MNESDGKGTAGPSLGLDAVAEYRIDARDRITFVSPAWIAFALNNGAPELTGERVLGKSLWGFVADKETRHLYGLLFKKVRRDRRVITLPFNCDSPMLRRYMELAISALPDGAIALAGHLLREESRKPARLLDPMAERSESFLRMCSWCKRVDAGANDWIEVEDAIRRLTLFSSSVLPQLTHGICPTCRSLFFEHFEREAPP
jgi:hypothetical protein